MTVLMTKISNPMIIKNNSPITNPKIPLLIRTYSYSHFLQTYAVIAPEILEIKKSQNYTQ